MSPDENNVEMKTKPKTIKLPARLKSNSPQKFASGLSPLGNVQTRF